MKARAHVQRDRRVRPMNKELKPRFFSVAGIVVLCLLIVETAVVGTLLFLEKALGGEAATSPWWGLLPWVTLVLPMAGVLVFTYFFVGKHGIVAFLGTQTALPNQLETLAKSLEKSDAVPEALSREFEDYRERLREVLTGKKS